LAVTIILKMELRRDCGTKSEIRNPKSETNSKLEFQNGQNNRGRPWLALVALVPMIWLVSVTFTAGVQKIWHPDTRIGFLSRSAQIRTDLLPPIEKRLKSAYVEAAREIFPGPEKKAALDKAVAEATSLRSQLFNNQLDAVVAGTFLLLVSIILVLSLREWILLLSRRKTAELRETPPTWLPDYAVAEGGRGMGAGAAGAAALALALAKELSGEAQLERAQQQAGVCECSQAGHGQSAVQPGARSGKTDAEQYVEMTEQRFNGVRRCC